MKLSLFEDNTIPIPEIRQLVLYRWPLEDGKKEGPSFPALIYKLYSGEDAKHGFVGLYVFSDDGIKQFKKVPYDYLKEGCWRIEE